MYSILPTQEQERSPITPRKAAISSNTLISGVSGIQSPGYDIPFNYILSSSRQKYRGPFPDSSWRLNCNRRRKNVTSLRTLTSARETIPATIAIETHIVMCYMIDKVNCKAIPSPLKVTVISKAKLVSKHEALGSPFVRRAFSVKIALESARHTKPNTKSLSPAASILSQLSSDTVKVTKQKKRVTDWKVHIGVCQQYSRDAMAVRTSFWIERLRSHLTFLEWKTYERHSWNAYGASEKSRTEFWTLTWLFR